MKKLNKKDLLYIIITITIFIIALIITYNKNFLHTQLVQFSKEISSIDYLRNLYYNNFNLFPDFAFNIGNGQNIYYLAEYGLLSPITLISYLLPFISIKTYLSVITIIFPIISTILLYRFFYNQKYSSEICFLISLIFLLSTNTLYITYTSPLLSCYITFLIISIYGVDKVFEKNKGYLLTIGIFLMFMTSYKESISGIICILIYSIYKYLKHMNTITIKSLLKRIITIIIPIIVSLLCSSILLLPTIISLSGNTINNNYLDNYILGLPLIIIPSIINYFKKDKANIILSIILIITIIISIFLKTKLISFIPLYFIVIAEFFNNIKNNKINLKQLTIFTIPIIAIIYIIQKNQIILIEAAIIIIALLLYYLVSKRYLIIILITIYLLINPTLINIPKTQYKLNTTDHNRILELLNITKKDNTIYRTHIDIDNIFNYNHYSSTMNTNINNSLYNELNNEIIFDNKKNNNIISLLLNNNKYIITDKNPIQGYELVTNIDNLKLYKNNNVLPIGFATSNIMSYEDFSKLNKTTRQEILLNVIIADTETKNNFISNTKKIEIPIEDIFKENNLYNRENEVFINTKEKLQIEYELPKKYQNKILFIRFKTQNSRNNQLIKINNNEKHISKSRHTLEYILDQRYQNKLIFTFSEGQYYLSDFEFYILDYANIENSSSKIDPFIIEPHNTNGDKIIGTIDVKQDSYFMLTIPYDNGFTILVDNEITEYEKVDETYIGFPIKEGLHSIEIIYTVPYKYIAYLLSLLGIISFITITYFESKRKFN